MHALCLSSLAKPLNLQYPNSFLENNTNIGWISDYQSWTTQMGHRIEKRQLIHASEKTEISFSSILLWIYMSVCVCVYISNIKSCTHQTCFSTAEGSCVIRFPAQIQPEQLMPTGKPLRLFSFLTAHSGREGWRSMFLRAWCSQHFINQDKAR